MAGDRSPTCKDLAQAVIDDDNDSDPQLKRWLTPNRVSVILRNMGFQTHHTNHGSEVSIDSARLPALCQRFAVVVPNAESTSPTQTVMMVTTVMA